MASLLSFVGTLTEALDLNQATLSGCIDIIVIEHQDGSRHSTPFHVRFGKLQLLRSREKIVSIDVNGERAPLTMKLGRAGEAYFFEESGIDTDGEWPTSPLPCDDEYLDEDHVVVESIIDDLITSVEKSLMIDVDEPESIVVVVDPPRDEDVPSTRPKRIPHENLWSFWSWGWGSLPVRTKLATKTTGGYDGDDDEAIDPICIDLAPPLSSRPEFALPNPKQRSLSWVSSILGMFRARSGDVAIISSPIVRVHFSITRNGCVRLRIEACSAKSNSSLSSKLAVPPSSPSKLDLSLSSSPKVDHSSSSEIASSGSLPANDLSIPSIHTLELSICPEFAHEDDKRRKLALFREHQLSFEAFCSSPSLIYSPSLVVRYQDLFYPGEIALPMVISYLAFSRPLSADALETFKASPPPIRLQEQIELEEKFASGPAPLSQEDPATTSSLEEEDQRETALLETESSVSLKESAISTTLPDTAMTTTLLEEELAPAKSSFLHRWFGQDASSSASPSLLVDPSPFPGTLLSDGASSLGSSPRTLRPTSAMLRMLNLQQGANIISFSVESPLQGTQIVEGCIYLWSETTRIVISDVDGTITRSDLLGNIMPLMGKDWSQQGVTSFFSSIVDNGYSMLYLTSRAIGQANVTRAYLNSIRQGTASLPQGPVVMSPDSLLSSFKREVIYRRPQEFKIPALRDVISLFPPGVHPFVAGFGNRDTDIESYIAVGIPPALIFIIDTKGAIHRTSNIHRTSYVGLTEKVEFMFPPFDRSRTRPHPTFGEFEYWRIPACRHFPVIPEHERRLGQHHDHHNSGEEEVQLT